jgi:hypothetical protein
LMAANRWVKITGLDDVALNAPDPDGLAKNLPATELVAIRGDSAAVPRRARTATSATGRKFRGFMACRKRLSQSWK